MKVNCLKKDLIKSVDIASKIISSKPTLPVLTCVLIEAENKKVSVKSTNLEFSIEISFPADVRSEGKIAVPAGVLIRTLKTIRSEGNVSLSLDGESVVLEVGDGKTTIKTLGAEDFPNIPQPDTKEKHTIQANTFAEGIRCVSQSASLSIIKPELSAVYIYHENNSLIFVATDQFRLSEKKIEYKTNLEIPPVIIPVSNAHELVRVLENVEGEVDVYIDENQISIKTSDLYATSRIIDGSFPDYKVIIPKETTTEVILLKNDLANCLQKMQIFADKFGKTNLHVYPTKKTFTASARNNDLGEVFDSPETTLTGEDLDIAFNHKYLSDAMAPMSADSVTLSFAGIGKPLIIRGVGDSSFTYLVMPMNR